MDLFDFFCSSFSILIFISEFTLVLILISLFASIAIYFISLVYIKKPKIATPNLFLFIFSKKPRTGKMEEEISRSPYLNELGTKFSVFISRF